MMVAGVVETFRLLIMYVTAYFTTGRLFVQCVCVCVCVYTRWRTQEFDSEGVQQIQLRRKDRENGDLGGGSVPSQVFWRQM